MSIFLIRENQCNQWLYRFPIRENSRNSWLTKKNKFADFKF